MPRWVKLVGAVVAGVAVVAAVGVAVVWTRLPQIVAERASAATGRAVTIGGLRVSPGRWIGVELRDVRVANVTGGTRVDMASLGRLTGEVALGPLLRGAVVARDVRVEKADLLLETVDGQPNWRNGSRRPEPVDHGRPGFPTLLGLQFQGVITFRTSSGSNLVTTLDGVRVEAASADAPVRLSGPGSYQGAPVMLDFRLGSFDQLHDAAQPFPTDTTMTSGDTVLHFAGTMTDPLNADGAEGRMSLTAPTPGPLEKIAGLDPTPAPPLRLEGPFRHEHALWRMDPAEGALGEAKLVGGTVGLREGSSAAHTPDRLGLDLRFDRVDVDRLLAAFGSAAGESSFRPEAAPDPEVTAELGAAAMTFEQIPFTRPQIAVSLQPGVLKVDAASSGALGGAVKLDGQLAADAAGTATLTALLAGTGLDVRELKAMLGVDEMPLAGRIDVHVATDGTGPTARAALHGGRTDVVATMSGGSVSTELVELASTDVAGLFRSKQATTALGCMLAVLEVRDGMAALGPVRLRSADGTIVARGEVNLARGTMDMVVASEARTTGLLALDVPLRLTGRVGDPSIAVADAAAKREALADRATGSLPASVRPFAQRSACAR